MEGQLSIFDFPEYLPKQKPVEVGTCLYSKHKCNKENLWEIADTLDDIKCQKVCCRKCNERGCGARCNGSKEPQVFYKYMFSDDFIPYIVDTLLTNTLLEPFVTPLIEKLKSVDDWVYAKDVPSMFDKTLFKLTKTQYFECKGEHFSIRRTIDNPPFEKTGAMPVQHCGSDYNRILATVFAKDIAVELMERINKE